MTSRILAPCLALPAMLALPAAAQDLSLEIVGETSDPQLEIEVSTPDAAWVVVVGRFSIDPPGPRESQYAEAMYPAMVRSETNRDAFASAVGLAHVPQMLGDISETIGVEPWAVDAVLANIDYTTLEAVAQWIPGPTSGQKWTSSPSAWTADNASLRPIDWPAIGAQGSGTELNAGKLAEHFAAQQMSHVLGTSIPLTDQMVADFRSKASQVDVSFDAIAVVIPPQTGTANALPQVKITRSRRIQINLPQPQPYEPNVSPFVFAPFLDQAYYVPATEGLTVSVELAAAVPQAYHNDVEFLFPSTIHPAGEVVAAEILLNPADNVYNIARCVLPVGAYSNPAGLRMSWAPTIPLLLTKPSPIAPDGYFHLLVMPLE